jgi:hypothetical protein
MLIWKPEKVIYTRAEVGIRFHYVIPASLKPSSSHALTTVIVKLVVATTYTNLEETHEKI